MIITQLAIGASYAVDLTLAVGSLFPARLDNVLASTDVKLRMRALLTMNIQPNPETFDEPPGLILGPQGARLAFSGFESLPLANWELRSLIRDVTHHQIIFDQQVAVIAPTTPRAADQGLFLVDDPERVAEMSGRFEDLWQASTPVSLIYQDVSAPPGKPEPATLASISDQYWSRLIQDLARHPELLYTLEPRHFEELIAHLLTLQGLDVKLTPATRDGGKDILAFLDTPAGRHLYCVECKRYAPERPVEVRLVRELYGVVESLRATGGILVTTSSFTKDAQSFRETIEYRMDLKDYHDLVSWIRKFA